ncbi:MAG TPA: hypothetical protein VF733_03375 [Candidatus Saccharimonadales bacterium]
MSQPEIKRSKEEVLPYFLAEYWDGEVLGAHNDRIQTDVANGRERRFARAELVDYLDREGDRFALDAYGWNQTFDPAEYKPGTVVAFRMEQATLGRQVTAAFLGKCAGLEVPLIDKSLPRSKDFREAALYARDLRGYFQYNSRALWGVVVVSKDERHRLAQPFSTYVDYSPPNSRVGHAWDLHDRLAVGSTVHHPRGVRRVTALEVCVNGKTVPQRAGVLGWLRKFGLAAAH